MSSFRVFSQKSTVVYVRWALGGVFIFAALDKILNPQAFAQMIYNYQILPGALINLTALILPWLELLLGLLLICGWWLGPAIILANLLLATFFGALLYNLARGLDIHCGCFSTSTEGDPTQLWYLVRDSGFLMMGACLYYRVLLNPSPDQVAQEEPGPFQKHHPVQEM